jgi:hypothetical protein
MGGQDGLVDIAHVACEVRKDFVELFGHGIADGIGGIDRRRAGVDRGFDDLRENSSSVRDASSGENSTSAQKLRANLTLSTAVWTICSFAMLSLYSR